MEKEEVYKWIIIILTIGIAIYVYFSGIAITLIERLGRYGIIGVLITGIFFSYAFTSAPATASLIAFTNYFDPITLSFIAATGTMIGDLIIFNIIKKKLPNSMKNAINKSWIGKLKKSKFKLLVSGLGAMIIASPLPDEMGIAILGIYDLDDNKFMLLSFVLGFIGIFILTSIAWLI